MRVLLCPDSFKGCMNAPGVAHAMRRGVLRAGGHDVTTLPVSDGGEGFTQAIAQSTDERTRCQPVTASHGAPTNAPWAGYTLNGARVGAFTVADIVGHGFVPKDTRDPGALTTRGIGEMLLALRDAGVERIIVGLGGSGTVDGGVGLASSLGFCFLDARGEPVEPVGNRLVDIARVERSSEETIEGVRITAAHDVNNPLTGPDGAARVFGPQKGATREQVEQLDAGLANLHRLCINAGLCDGKDHEGDGAAGGLGFGLRVFAGATLTPGSDVIIETLDLRRRLSEADLVITGEGRLDGQSASGKIAWAVGRLAKDAGVPCVCVAGSLGDGWDEASDVFSRVVSSTPEGMDESEGIERAEELIAEAVCSLPELAKPR